MTSAGHPIAKHPLLREAYELCLAIEECGCSEKLTAAVVKASNLQQSIDAHLDQVDKAAKSLCYDLASEFHPEWELGDPRIKALADEIFAEQSSLKSTT